MKLSGGTVQLLLLNKCYIKFIKKMKIIKTLKIRHFGATYISVPFFANIRISLKKSQQKVTSSKNCVFDKF